MGITGWFTAPIDWRVFTMLVMVVTYPFLVFLLLVFPWASRKIGLRRRDSGEKLKRSLNLTMFLIALGFVLCVTTAIVPVITLSDRFLLMGLSFQVLALLSLLPSITGLLPTLRNEIREWWFGEEKLTNKKNKPRRVFESFQNKILGRTSNTLFPRKLIVYGLFAFITGLFMEIVAVYFY
jgi:hypothetical protein